MYCVDFNEAQCLLNSEVAILLETSQQAHETEEPEGELSQYVLIARYLNPFQSLCKNLKLCENI
jgi:hypothetical protein